MRVPTNENAVIQTAKPKMGFIGLGQMGGVGWQTHSASGLKLW